MYYDFSHFTGDPFAETADPAFLYFSPSHKAALHTLSRGIATHQEVMALFGAPGLGKTTILRACQARTPPQTHLIYIGYPKLSFAEVLTLVCQECDLGEAPASVTAMLSQLYQAAHEKRQQGWRIVLLIDEAHQLPVPTLEGLLQLLLLQATTGEPLFQLVLAGLPAFQHTLNLPQLRALKQRLAVTITLAPLTAADSRAYIRHRLARVLLPDDELFTPGALRRIIRAARGNPRVLNTLCSTTLVTGSLDQHKPVSAAMARTVIADTAATRRQRYWWMGVAVTSVLLVGGLGWGWHAQWPRQGRARVVAPPPLAQPLADVPHDALIDGRGMAIPRHPPQAPPAMMAQAEAVPEPQRSGAGSLGSAPLMWSPSGHSPDRPGTGTDRDKAPHAGAVRAPQAPDVLPPQTMPAHEQAARPDTAIPASRQRPRVPWETPTGQDRLQTHAPEDFTMAGEWTVINTVEETTYPAFQQLRLHFHLVIRQHGATFDAVGEKYQENGRPLPSAARRPITLQGTLTEDAGIEATFQESGHARTTQGHFRLTRRTPDHLTGTFSSTAAGARGTSQWIRRR